MERQYWQFCTDYIFVVIRKDCQIRIRKRAISIVIRKNCEIRIRNVSYFFG